MAKTLKILLFLLIPYLSNAQQVKVDGYFMQDSAKIGERVGYVLKATYSESTQIIFPDSTFDFSPMVLLEKKTYISYTQDSITQDSTVYFVSNFSLDPTSYLTLPVYELARYDSVVHYPMEAELKLKLTLDSIPEQLVFQQNNIYQSLEKSFNWIIIGIILGGVLLLLGVIYFLFADKFQEYWKERREKRRWEQFEKRWKTQTALLTKAPSIESADEVIGLWKGYMESITHLPIKEWTSSEIGERLDNLEIFKALRAIDLIIYAGESSESEEATSYLLEVAREKYQEKQTKIKHERAAV
ncbi:hypothetical protein [Algoriphagus winogradskyi]|uniref:Oxygen tolerance protein BatD n=1 Tax=Algoriphagus winogradskyi TaxID=237017 RepID=A0ABY1PKE1_9BACT|nr:hypothetical protein [Algoriphagus winogradskyi]SMP34340.1 hypothetical protein SAMN06265367_109165 [Algoriphagus winogradskyi]